MEDAAEIVRRKHLRREWQYQIRLEHGTGNLSGEIWCSESMLAPLRRRPPPLQTAGLQTPPTSSFTPAQTTNDGRTTPANEECKTRPKTRSRTDNVPATTITHQVRLRQIANLYMHADTSLLQVSAVSYITYRRLLMQKIGCICVNDVFLCIYVAQCICIYDTYIIHLCYNFHAYI